MRPFSAGLFALAVALLASAASLSAEEQHKFHYFLLWIISILVNVGMWSERFVIIVMGLQREFIPSGWHAYRPTWVDITMFAGTFCFFLFLFLIFLRLLPFIPVAEVKELNRELGKEEH